MSRDNKDRYGYRHRPDNASETGESMPGTTGESEGTFHDRATQDNNVIVDGEAVGYESYQRKQQKSNTSENQDSSSQSPSTKTQNDLVGRTIKLTIDRISGSGNPIAEYNGQQIHVAGGQPGQTVSVEITNAASGYLEGRIKTRE